MIEYRNITKTFAGVTALDDVSFSISPGQCHGLMGENGAGKSTCGKILAGIYRPDAGQILIEGQRKSFGSPADARAAGIGMVHQELAFCPDLSVAENLCMGSYPRRFGFLINRPEMETRADKIARRHRCKAQRPPDHAHSLHRPGAARADRLRRRHRRESSSSTSPPVPLPNPTPKTSSPSSSASNLAASP